MTYGVIGGLQTGNPYGFPVRRTKTTIVNGFSSRRPPGPWKNFS